MGVEEQKEAMKEASILAGAPEPNGIRTLGATISAASTFIGGLAGLVSIGLVVFYGGALVEKVRGLDNRLTEIEKYAAPITREHMRMDDQRDLALESRVTRLEEMRTAIAEIKSQLSINTLKIDDIKEAHVRTEKSMDAMIQRMHGSNGYGNGAQKP